MIIIIAIVIIIVMFIVGQYYERRRFIKEVECLLRNQKEIVNNSEEWNKAK